MNGTFTQARELGTMTILVLLFFLAGWHTFGFPVSCHQEEKEECHHEPLAWCQVELTFSGQTNGSLGLTATPWERVTINDSPYFLANEAFRNVVRQDILTLITTLPEIGAFDSNWSYNSGPAWFFWRDPTETHGMIWDPLNGSYLPEDRLSSTPVLDPTNSCSLVPIPNAYVNHPENYWNANVSLVDLLWAVEDYQVRKAVVQAITETVTTWWYVIAVDITFGPASASDCTESTNAFGSFVLMGTLMAVFALKRVDRCHNRVKLSA
ncbi:MAG: hypothetical protein ACFFGZ_01100 [Candidatus Thorarchaeota archaeon]